jgi:hypothetical protein
VPLTSATRLSSAPSRSRREVSRPNEATPRPNYPGSPGVAKALALTRARNPSPAREGIHHSRSCLQRALKALRRWCDDSIEPQNTGLTWNLRGRAAHVHRPDGAFEIHDRRGIASGDYKLFSWNQVEGASGGSRFPEAV